MYKKWVIIAIVIFGFGVFSWQMVPRIKSHIMPELPRQMLGQTKNTAVTKTVKNIGRSKGITQLGLKPGVYDLVVLSDQLTNMPDLSDAQRGNRYLGFMLDETTALNVGHDESLKFEPAEFKPLKKNKGKYVITTPGNYVVNRQIPEGRYEVKIHEIKRSVVQHEKFRPSTITVNSKFLNGNGSGDGQVGVISSTLKRSSSTILLEKHRLLSIGFSGVVSGSYVELMPLKD